MHIAQWRKCLIFHHDYEKELIFGFLYFLHILRKWLLHLQKNRTFLFKTYNQMPQFEKYIQTYNVQNHI